MCIAVYKPTGAKVPTNETLKTCFTGNPDGAGYMYASNGKVHIEKGLMTFDDFKKSFDRTIRKLGGRKAARKIPMVLHFRISTQGGVQPELTHPFAFGNNYDDMKKLSCDVDCAVAHNGIISATSSGAKDHNDTMEFIKDIAYPLMNSHDKSLDVHGLIDKFLNGNRVIFLRGNGTVDMYGDWVEDKGVFYSNQNYKQVKTLLKSWEDYSDYYYDRYYGAVKDNSKAKTKQLTHFQRKDLREIGETWCDHCGNDLYIEYDPVDDKYYAYCDYCGQRYEVDEETADAYFELQYNWGN